MKILFLASEVSPYSKTGGLADVAGALPAALAELGHEVVVATPHYASVREREPLEKLDRTLTLRFPFGAETATYSLASPRPGHRVLFVGNPRFFARSALYGDQSGEYPDNHLRFAFFTLASLSATSILGFWPDVLHLNDWQTGLGAVALRRGYRGTAIEKARCVFTIHNLAYQGLFPKRAMDELGLPWDLFVPSGLEFYDRLSFLKAGIAFADALTTVSPRYAQEIQTPEWGSGLDGLLRVRNHVLHGILNAVDVDEWDPAKDRHIPCHFHADDLSGKAKCKAKLLERFHLTPDSGGARGPPLFGIVSRLVSQKGFDILLPALRWLLEREVRFVALGSGEPRYEEGLRSLQRLFPEKVGLYIGYDVDLSHLVEAGCDFFLMPSLFEPCGLNQMYSLLYGTVPIVRSVGGLDDTVIDVEPEGNGIKFGPFQASALVVALQRALALYADEPRFEAVRVRGMRTDFSWKHSAREYEAVYRGVGPTRDLPKADKAK